MTYQKNWCFTLNNFTTEEFEKFKSLKDNGDVKYIIFQHECGDSGTNHLQGYVQLASKKRMSYLKSIDSRAHWEPARGTAEQNRNYCSKQPRVAGPWEFGESTCKGKRNDIKEFVEAMNENLLTEDQLISDFPEVLARYPRFVERVARHSQQKKVVLQQFTPRPGWQMELTTYLTEQPDTRKIRWYVDEKGGSGKSTFTRSHLDDAYVITGGTYQNIYYGYNYESIVIFDITREVEERTPYGVMEAFKNGYFLSTKYEVKRVKFSIPHVIVFSNFYPDKTKLSIDRWDIHKINETPLGV